MLLAKKGKPLQRFLQDGLVPVFQGVAPGMSMSEEEAYGDLLLRDRIIAGRIWPAAENQTGLVLLDHPMARYGHQAMKERVASCGE